MRSSRIIRIVLIVAAVAVVAYVGFLVLDRHVSSVDVELVPESIPADGVSSALLEIRLVSRFGNRLSSSVLPRAPRVEVTEGARLVKVVPLGDSLRYRIIAGFDRGRAVIHVIVPGYPAPFEEVLLLTPSLADRNHNGYPDAVDLSSTDDREAFRRWFVAIALGQLLHVDDQWQDRDCAGLVRYCFREALKRHDNAWLHDRRWLVTAAIPDVKKYNYPAVPMLGTHVFKAGVVAGDSGEIVAASQTAGEANEPRERSPRGEVRPEEFAAFAEASRLKDNALAFVSRDEADARPGDVIFYLNDTRSAWPYHTMIYAGNGVTVYHTGPDGENPGIVKRMTLGTLASHPNPRWHPVAANPYFLGFYRWRILL